MAFSNLDNCITLAENFLKEYCPNLDAKERISKLDLYSYYFKSFSCEDGKHLPDPKIYFNSKIRIITELFTTYYFQLVNNDLSNHLWGSFGSANVVIKLLIPNNTEEYDNFSYKENFDILEYYYPNSNNLDYYILKLDDQVLVLTNEGDDLTLSTKIIRKHFEGSHGALKSVVLKAAKENITTFMINLTKYKKSRFEEHLAFLDNCQSNNTQLRDDWWQEFGLSLIPYSQCSTATCRTNYKYPTDLPSRIINCNTRTLLSSLGTSINSIFLSNASSDTIYEIVKEKSIAVQTALNRSKIFDDVALNLNDPAFQLSFITKDVVGLLEKIFIILNQKTSFSFKTVQSSLSKISTLKSRIYRSVGTGGENGTRLVFVNTLNNRSNTGYGYKFVFLSGNEYDIAQFRTDYELKDEKLIVPVKNNEYEAKKYLVLNNLTFKPKPDHVMYEVNNQLRRRFLKVEFSGIPIQDDDLDENCNSEDYFENCRRNNLCRRQQRFTQKNAFENDGLDFLKKRTNLTDEEILKIFKIYTFPNRGTLMLHLHDWLKRNLTIEPPWSDLYKIEFADILNKIRFDLRFETHEISNYEGQFRIRTIYTTAERNRIQENTTIRNIIESYNKQKGMYSLSFHDYYAIRNFANKGYTRITGDTNEAKLMKLALYKLAIRQSEDPVETFEEKLFRVVSIPTSLVERFYLKKFTTLQRFTETYPNIESAIRFTGYPGKDYINVVYEMIFRGPYVRAKIEKFYKTKETSVILLPGSKFQIIHSTTVDIGGLGSVLKFKLIFQHSPTENFAWYKNIMHEIKKINF